MALGTVTVKLEDVGLENRAGVRCSLALAQSNLPAITADALIDPTTSDTDTTDDNGVATLAVNATQDYRRAEGLADGTYILKVGSAISRQVIVPRGTSTARSLIETGLGPDATLPTRAQYGVVLSDTAPLNPVPGLGWGRIINGQLIVERWNGSGWQREAGGGGGTTVVANPAEDATGNLDKINIGGVVWNIPEPDVPAIVDQRALRAVAEVAPDTFTDADEAQAFTATFTLAAAVDSLWKSDSNEAVAITLGSTAATVGTLTLVRTSSAQVTYRIAATVTAQQAATIRAAAAAAQIVNASIQLLKGTAALLTMDRTLRLISPAEAGDSLPDLAEDGREYVLRGTNRDDGSGGRTETIFWDQDREVPISGRIGSVLARVGDPNGDDYAFQLLADLIADGTITEAMLAQAVRDQLGGGGGGLTTVAVEAPVTGDGRTGSPIGLADNGVDTGKLTAAIRALLNKITPNEQAIEAVRRLVPQASNAAPTRPTTASAGTSNTYARGDHRHPKPAIAFSEVSGTATDAQIPASIARQSAVDGKQDTLTVAQKVAVLNLHLDPGVVEQQDPETRIDAIVGNYSLVVPTPDFLAGEDVWLRVFGSGTPLAARVKMSTRAVSSWRTNFSINEVQATNIVDNDPGGTSIDIEVRFYTADNDSALVDASVVGLDIVQTPRVDDKQNLLPDLGNGQVWISQGADPVPVTLQTQVTASLIISTITSYDAAQNRFEDSSGNEVTVPNGAIVVLPQAAYDAAVSDADFTPNAAALFLTT